MIASFKKENPFKTNIQTHESDFIGKTLAKQSSNSFTSLFIGGGSGGDAGGGIINYGGAVVFN